MEELSWVLTEPRSWAQSVWAAPGDSFCSSMEFRINKQEPAHTPSAFSLHLPFPVPLLRHPSSRYYTISLTPFRSPLYLPPSSFSTPLPHSHSSRESTVWPGQG